MEVDELRARHFIVGCRVTHLRRRVNSMATADARVGAERFAWTESWIF